MTEPENKSVVLVVDDEQSIRHLVAKTLGDKYALLIAPGQAYAHALAKAFPADIDLLVTDVRLAGGGMELATGLQNSHPGMRGLLTSSSRDFILPQGLSFLAKPFSPAELLSVVAAMLR